MLLVKVDLNVIIDVLSRKEKPMKRNNSLKGTKRYLYSHENYSFYCVLKIRSILRTLDLCEIKEVKLKLKYHNFAY